MVYTILFAIIASWFLSTRLTMLLGLSDDWNPSSSASYVIAVDSTSTVYTWRLTDRTDSSPQLKSSGDPLPPRLDFISSYTLPIPGDLSVQPTILPVDPMGWAKAMLSDSGDTVDQDVLLSIDEHGTVDFWRPSLNAEHETGTWSKAPWTKTGTIRTGKKNVALARCSSTKKTALGKLFMMIY